jgi:hypothetical protein
MPVFSKRRGYDPPKEIVFREELPANLRPPIIEIVGRYFSDADVREAIEKLLDPYGLEPSKLIALETPTGPPTQGGAPASGTKAYLLNCLWFRVSHQKKPGCEMTLLALQESGRPLRRRERTGKRGFLRSAGLSEAAHGASAGRVGSR